MSEANQRDVPTAHVSCDTDVSNASGNTQLQSPTENAAEPPARGGSPVVHNVGFSSGLSCLETAEQQSPDVVPTEDIPSLESLRQKVLDARGPRLESPQLLRDYASVSESVQPAGEDEASSSSSTSSESGDSSDSDDSTVDGGLSGSVPQSRTGASRTEPADDFDSDDSDTEGTGTAKLQGPTTKNEMGNDQASGLFGNLPFKAVPENLLPTLKPLGRVHSAVENVLVIAQAPEQKSQSQYTLAEPNRPNDSSGPVLDAGSLVCLRSGHVIGLIFETFGSLLQPLYSLLLESPASAAAYDIGSEVLYLPAKSTILRPAELRAAQGKGSDASNVHDEEPNEWEIDAMEFSDDEQEAEWKRRLKEKKKGKKSAHGVNEDRQANMNRIHPGKSGGQGKGRSYALPQNISSSTSRAASLPSRPNWQLDDPGQIDSTPLSYDAVGRTGPMVNVPDEESKPLPKPPLGAGLPLNPLLGAPESHSSLGSGTEPPTTFPPPGSHINPAFAQRWDSRDRHVERNFADYRPTPHATAPLSGSPLSNGVHPQTGMPSGHQAFPDSILYHRSHNPWGVHAYDPMQAYQAPTQYPWPATQHSQNQTAWHGAYYTDQHRTSQNIYASPIAPSDGYLQSGQSLPSQGGDYSSQDAYQAWQAPQR